MPKDTSIRTPLRPEHREYVEYIRHVLEHLEDADAEAVKDALSRIDPETLSEEDFEEALFHLSREYRTRTTD